MNMEKYCIYDIIFKHFGNVTIIYQSDWKKLTELVY